MTTATMTTEAESLDALLTRIRACRACESHLPLGARPLIHASPSSRLLIASQAPGTKAHESATSFLDASGDRLREWLGFSREEFYDARRVAIMPMGMCYPGRFEKGGDRPPRPECAPLWRERVLARLPELRLTLLVGSYAQDHVLGRGSVTERVRNWRTHLARGAFPLPHPSWRTGAWEKRSPWFREEVIPALREAVRAAIAAPGVSDAGREYPPGSPERPRRESARRSPAG